MPNLLLEPDPNAPQPPKPWYLSKRVWAIVLNILYFGAQQFIVIPPEIKQILDYIILALGGGAVAATALGKKPQ